MFISVRDILTTPGEVFILSPFWWWPPQWFLKCQSLPPTAVLLNLPRQSDSTIKFINPWNTFKIINHQLNNKYFLITKFKVHTVTYDQFFLHKKFHWGKSQHSEPCSVIITMIVIINLIVNSAKFIISIWSNALYNKF